MRAGTKPRGEALRSALIDAAEQRLAQTGLAGLSVRQLAADTNCGAGTIGYLFGSLDHLVLLANERTLIQIADRLDRALSRAQNGGKSGAQNGDMAARMEALALAYLDYAQTERPRWEALFLHRLPVGEALPGWYAARRDDLIGRIAVSLDGQIQADTLIALARTIFEAVQGVVMLGLDQKLGEADAVSLRDRMRMLIRLLAAGLKHTDQNKPTRSTLA